MPPSPASRRAFLVCGLLLLPTGLAAQEAATGTTTIEQPPPQPRGFVIEQDGRPVTGTIAPGGAADIAGANVVIVDETPRATRLTVRNDVLFDFDKAELRPEAAEALGRVAEIIRQRAPRAVRIVGHTDSVGSDSYNQTLSERRAQSVERWLAANGGGLPPMRAEGRGEAEPVAPNTTDGRDNPEGRQRNRRVEVLLER
jgi:outer membrane protein OmpA-like peptidoglycan-associated protein